jgi:kynureninase
VTEPFQPGRDFAVALDRGDPLARFREEFHIPKSADGEEEIYFAGNSLGTSRAPKYVDEELEKWKRLAVKAHFSRENPWMPYHELLAEPMARLVGASTSASISEVVTMNSLTVNLHLMMASFYRPTRERHRILLEDHAFPSDDYALESQAILRGFDPAEPSCGCGPRHKGSIDAADRPVLGTRGESIAQSCTLSPGPEREITRAREGASSGSTWPTRRET